MSRRDAWQKKESGAFGQEEDEDERGASTTHCTGPLRDEEECLPCFPEEDEECLTCFPDEEEDEGEASVTHCTGPSRRRRERMLAMLHRR